jgi:hypothetical protein
MREFVMKQDHPGFSNPVDADLNAQREKMIQHLNEKYPSPNRPYLRATRIDEPWGIIVYAMAAM